MGIGVNEYARHRGISHPAVSKAIKIGRIKLLPDGTIDPEMADKQWAASVSRVNKPKGDKQGKKSAPAKVAVSDADVTPGAITKLSIPDGLSLTDIKALHEEIKARLAYLGLAKDCGVLSDASLVNKQLFALGRTARDSWLNWVNQVAGGMAAELRVGQHNFTILLENEVKSFLTEISNSKYACIVIDTSEVSLTDAANQIRAASTSYELNVPSGASLTDIKAIHETVKARRALYELIELRENLMDVSKTNEQLIVIHGKIQEGWLAWIDGAAKTLAQELKIDASLVKGALEGRVKDFLAESKAENFQVGA
jgi:hypothetical protein